MLSSTHNTANQPAEFIADNDDLPEERKTAMTSPVKDSNFIKSLPPRMARRESLLTRQLHGSEGESYPEDERRRVPLVIRGMSASSNPSVASTAELTSDNELTSPGTRTSTPSPPLPATRLHSAVPFLDKSIAEEPLIVGQDDTSPQKPMLSSETEVEAGLGRRRCITFACGRKSSSPKAKADAPIEQQKVAEPPKRKCMLTFACPTRPSAQGPPPSPRFKINKTSSPYSPGPKSPAHRSPIASRSAEKSRRGSDVKSESPRLARKAALAHRRKYSEDIDDGLLEARRFHEFGTTEKVEEEWVQESTCHRSRLTIKDTLQKENVIRQLGEEVEEEALEDDDQGDEEDLLEDDEEEELDDEDVEDENDDDEVDDEELAVDNGEVSDAGFDTDDEEGFARSDDGGQDSDDEWWQPGRSTAATSTDHLDLVRPSLRRTSSDSSLESARGANGFPQKSQPKIKRRGVEVPGQRPGTPDLPDSTDFVCGTLDEDRPLEQAYKTQIEQRKAAKHKVTPQDIDPTFPTSDPEMDEEDEEEDDDAIGEPDESEALFMQDEIDDVDRVRRGRASSGANKRSSPHSPRRFRSPPPPQKRTMHRSPPPTKKPSTRSPPPELARKHPARSPAPPRRLFSQSPKRERSPASKNRLTSPPNSRRNSPDATPSQAMFLTPNTLGQRPQPTHTASLPRVATLTNLRDAASSSGEQDDDLAQDTTELRSRGAIDIVKGLEKKRQRRREKLYQKHCQQKNKERERKPKPGKGAERMREVGLELAAYKGKKEHMLSY